LFTQVEIGSHLNACDMKAARKSVSGLVKLVYPHAELSKEELSELGLEGRRRVKEQLKKMGSFGYHQTSFSLIDKETREKKFRRGPRTGRPRHDLY
jgi:ATP-dependent Lon protease